MAAQLAELRQSSDGADVVFLASCENQLAILDGLQQNVATSSGGALVSLRSDIGSAIGSASAAVQQARAAATSGASGQAGSVTTTGAALHKELDDLKGDLYDRHIFNDYLTFSSKKEEDAYRQREAESRRYTDQQLAQGTPEGELNAAGAVTGQMLDAHAHGAGNSPEFAERWERLVETTSRHRDAVRAAGLSTDEFDRNLKSSVRRYLKDKGLSDADVEAALASSANPLDAVKPYLNSEADTKALELSTDKAEAFAAPPKATITTAVAMPAAPAAPITAPGLDDVMATFRAAGVKVSEQPDPGADPASQAIGGKQLLTTKGGRSD